MYILGTAGHVDHGKTALVKMLTGSDTDSLPEEKRRGLTIELGFARLDGPVSVGVIDVPGHERFIRNMVAGTWAVHCALLVIASDDGWMNQTTDHAHVLKGMGVPSIVAVFTKSDLAEPDKIHAVKEHALSRCRVIFGYTPPYAVTSTKNGTGIQECRRVIFEALNITDPRIFPPCLYVDRSFTVQGSGQIVTGSLAGGTLATGDRVFLLPERIPLKVRLLQTHGKVLQQAKPVSRTAINLHGAHAQQLSRGCCITPALQQFFITLHFTAVLSSIEDGEPVNVKNHQEAEILYGTYHGRCTIHFLDRQESHGVITAAIVCPKQAAVFWGQRFILLRPGGSQILSWGQVLLPESASREEQLAAKKIIREHRGIPRQITTYSLFRLVLRGYAHIKESLDTRMNLLGRSYERVGTWHASTLLLKESSAVLAKEAGKQGGATREELLKKLGLPESFGRTVIARCCENGIIERNNNIYKTPAAAVELQPAAAALLDTISKAGIRGYDLQQLYPEQRALLGVLLREGLVVILDRMFIYTTCSYTSMAGSILKGRKNGDIFSIADAKKCVPLSRKYMIPLLNRMEEDGYVQRSGNVRKVIAVPLHADE